MIRANSLNLHIEKNGGPGRRRFKKEDKENLIYLNISAGAIRWGWDQLDGEAAVCNLNRRNSTQWRLLVSDEKGIDEISVTRPFQILCKPSRSCRIEHDFGGFIHEKETEPNPGRDGKAREDIRDAAITGCQQHGRYPGTVQADYCPIHGEQS